MSTTKRSKMITKLTQSIARLESINNFSRLIPEVGSNFVYCLTNATDLSEVAGLTGRIILVRGKPTAVASSARATCRSRVSPLGRGHADVDIHV